jgi:hypothetical protein
MPAPWIALLALALAGGRTHPMHTAVAEIVQEDAGGRTAVQLRVYVDDLQAELGSGPGDELADSSMTRYLRGTFALADRTGRPVRLDWAGAERTGDVVLLRLRGEVPGGLAGARVTSLVLCERFEDQVNVVRATYAGRTTTLLFTGGEGAKLLP